jgi:xanthine dehydrogenase small subunit
MVGLKHADLRLGGVQHEDDPGLEHMKQECSVEPQLVVNGRTCPLGEVGGHVTLLEWLRESGYTGSKEGCAEGECGACSVLVARPDTSDGSPKTRWTAINACLVPAAGLDGQEIITAEGLGQPGALHPVQQEMAVRGGSQCGYCTPGFICSMAGEYYRADRHPTASGRSEPDADVVEGVEGPAPDHEHGPNGFDLHSLSGNLCRCTGYRPIRDAAYALGEPDASDPIFARLQRPAPAPVATRTTSSQGDFVRPVDLAETLEILADHPTAVLVAGSTDWGVELNIRHSRVPLTVGIDRLEELRGLTVTDDSIDIGAALTLSEIERTLAGRVPLLAELFPQFASRLIRNGATLGGNLGTGSPIGDTPPGLLALDCSLVLASQDGEREVALADYFTGYRQTVKRAGELIRTIRIPLPVAPITAFHKIAKRRFDDISSVAVAFALRLDGPNVADIKIGLGGVAATPLRALETEAALNGRPWTREVVDAAADVLARAGTPMSDHRASADYRTAMLPAALRKFYAENAAPAYQEA